MAYSYKGAITFGLVYIPITLELSVKEHDIGFNMLEKKTKSRVKYKKTCVDCNNKEISNEDIVKGYQYEKGKYVYKLPKTILEEMLSISDELNRGYELKELFLDIVANSDYKNAERDLLAWIDLCKESKIVEFIEASKTIESWLPYIVNSFIDKRFTNGFTEGLNNKIKVIKRNAYGYKNFEFFRLRLLYILNGTLSGRSKNNDK